MKRKKTQSLYWLLIVLFATPFMNLCSDEVTHITKDNKRETLKGTIVNDSWDFVMIKTTDGKTIKIPAENLIDALRELSSPLRSAQAKAVTAKSAEEIKSADGLLEKIKARNGIQKWEKEEARLLQFKMWLNFKPSKAVQVAQEFQKKHPKSRHLIHVWSDLGRTGFNAKDPKTVKLAANQLRSMGYSLGQSQANFFDGIVLKVKGDYKGAEKKFRAVFKQLQTNKSKPGKRLWLDAATHYAQTLIKQEKLDQAREQLETLEKSLTELSERGHGLYYTLKGDILRLEKKSAEALYAYMHVVVQHPIDYDLHAHSLFWGSTLSKELNYSETAKKLAEELKKKYPHYKS